MNSQIKDKAIKKIMDLPKDQVAKILIFMAGLEAGCNIIASHSTNSEQQTLVKRTTKST